MATTPYPLPKTTRETAVLVGNGTAGPYGPTLWKVFDAVDVRVYARPSSDDAFVDVTGDVTITKSNGLAFDTVSVTFGASVPATTQFVIRSERLADRQLAVTRDGSIRSEALEMELSKIANTQQEQRRDIDRAVRFELGSPPIAPLPPPESGKVLVGNATNDGYDNAPIALGEIAATAATVAVQRDQAVAAAASAAASVIAIAGLAGSAIGIDPVATVTALKAVAPGTLVNGRVYELKGYSASGDGGGGRFVYDSGSSATANDATVFQHNSAGGRFLRLDVELELKQVGLAGVKTDAPRMSTLLRAGLRVRRPKRINTIAQIAAKWAAGLKAPIAIWGDSRVDGRVSTTDGTNEMTLYNSDLRLVSGVVPDATSYDHDQSEAPNAYPAVLQRMVRDFYGSATARIYNAGFRSRRVDDGWAATNIHNAIFGNPVYADAEQVWIDFGTNDSEFASGDTLRTNFYFELEAAILTIFSRGKQPVIMTTGPIASIFNNESEYGHNEEISNIIDQVKRDLARRYDLELIDLSGMLNDWLRRNGSYLTDMLLTDKLHFGDIGHNMQAACIFSQIIAPNMVPTVRGGEIIDASMDFARSPSANLASTSSARGWGQKVRHFSITTAIVANADGQNMIDAWVFADSNDLSLVYEHLLSTGANPSAISDPTKLPQLIVESQLFPLGANYTRTLYSGKLPGLVGGTPAATRIGYKHFVCRLDYGLNRIRLAVPSGFAAVFASMGTQLFLGGFMIVKDHADARPKAASNTLNASGQTVGFWKNALRESGPITLYSEAPPSGNSLRALPSPSLRGQNSYSLRRVGDAVEFKVRFDALAHGWGVLLGSYLVDSGVAVIGSGYNKRDDAMFGGSLYLYGGSTNLFFGGMNAAGTATLPLFDTGITTASLAGKPFVVKITQATLGSWTLEIFGDDGALLYTTTITDLDGIAEFHGGWVGGLYNNRAAAVSGKVTLDIMQVRQTFA